MVYVPAPQVEEIARLSGILNDTYIPYGAEGTAGQARQEAGTAMRRARTEGRVDPARAFTKATRLCSNSCGTCVDAVSNKKVDLDSVRQTELPLSAPPSAPTSDRRRAVVKESTEERARIRRAPGARRTTGPTWPAVRRRKRRRTR